VADLRTSWDWSRNQSYDFDSKAGMGPTNRGTWGYFRRAGGWLVSPATTEKPDILSKKGLWLPGVGKKSSKNTE